MKHVKIFILLVITVLCNSCNPSWPGGFWLRFHEKQIIDQASDQGPYGGSRFILWKSDQSSTFLLNEIVAFAHKNGWTYTASSPLSLKNLQTSLPMGNLPSQNDNTQEKKIRSAFTSDLKILIFSTRWEKEKPGSNKATSKNGIILLSDNGKAMAVSQTWGE